MSSASVTSVTVFRIATYVLRPLPATSGVVQVWGDCPNATSLRAITLGDSQSSTTSGQIIPGTSITPGSPIAMIFAATTSFNALRTALNQMGPGAFLQLAITYTLSNGIMDVSGISVPPVATALHAIEQKVNAIASTSAQINQRLEKDLSGAVLGELRTLNGYVSEALDILRGTSTPRGGRSPVESDVSDLIQSHALISEGERVWPGSSNGAGPETTADEERHAV